MKFNVLKNNPCYLLIVMSNIYGMIDVDYTFQKLLLKVLLEKAKQIKIHNLPLY